MPTPQLQGSHRFHIAVPDYSFVSLQCNVFFFMVISTYCNYLVLTPILCLFVQFFVLHQDYTFIHQNFAWDNEMFSI